MGIQITIRDVDEDVRDELAARAARERKSMQEFLKGELERIARRPSLKSVLESIESRKSKTGRRLAVKDILRARDSERK